MENTALTRQATRARIGPWYVLQARNPAAPGMKCNTLLGLIRKGQVTPKTIVRGPTTHQFWRFAARVKGISREFGICFSCGTRLETKATECPHCGKSQELPSNPDTLLEGDLPPSQPVFREVKSDPSAADVSHEEHSAPEETASLGIENLKPRRPPTPEEPLLNLDGAEEFSVTPAAPLPDPPRPTADSGPKKPNLAALTTPADADSPMQSRRRMKRHENVLTARDLATAFSLQYEPHAPSTAKNKSKLRRAVIMTVVILLIGGGAAVWFVPSLQERAIAQFHQIYPGAIAEPPATPAPAAHFGSASPSDNPPWSARMPKAQTPITTPTPNANTGSSFNGTTPGSAADSGTATASDEDLDALAMKLHNQGLDAEARHDYASAIAYYQQIEKLPREHWPADTEQLLGAARQRLSAGSGQ